MRKWNPNNTEYPEVLSTKCPYVSRMHIISYHILISLMIVLDLFSKFG